jgi:hypothetical protein
VITSTAQAQIAQHFHTTQIAYSLTYALFGTTRPSGTTPNPTVIADEVWAKLLWAGLNLEHGDLPGNSAGTYYPMELVRAVT